MVPLCLLSLGQVSSVTCEFAPDLLPEPEVVTEPAGERPDDIERDVPVYLPPDAEWDVELELAWEAEL